MITARTTFTLILTLLVIQLIFLMSGMFDEFERITLDWRFKLTPRPPSSPAICLIELDQKSCSHIGQWPWPRHWHALLIEALRESGAKMIGLDILFTEHASQTDDRALAEAIEKAGNVYLPIVFESPQGITYPLPALRKKAAGLGFINCFPDSDGVNRRIPLIIPYQKKYYPQFAFAMACDFLETPPDAVVRSINIPLEENGSFIINWAGKWNHTFKHYSFWDIVEAHKAYKAGGKRAPLLAAFKDKICLVGFSAPGTYDYLPIPIEAVYPNIGLHANVLNSILVDRFIKPLGKKWEALLLAVIILLLCLLVPRLSPLKALLLTILVFVAILWGAWFLFWKGMWLGMACLIITVPACYLVLVTVMQVTGSFQRAALWNLANKDELTGFYCLRYFREELERMLTRLHGKGRELAVILIKIDKLKTINDTYGATASKSVVRQASPIIRRVFEAPCVIGRYSHDVFIITVPDGGKDKIMNLAQSVMNTIRAHEFGTGSEALKLTLSIGVARGCDDAGDVIIRRADDALFEAIERGGGHICEYRHS
jgi:diguanylate cyclase (GGDEF)-like protein